MKTNLLILLGIIIFFGSCKKRSSDNTVPADDGKTCNITVVTGPTGSGNSSVQYVRDASGKLIKQIGINALGDTITVANYHWSQGLIDYSVLIPKSSSMLDSIHYYYDSQFRLVKTVRITYINKPFVSNTINFYYNSASQVVLSVAKNTTDSIQYNTDSLIYMYSGNNIASIAQYYHYSGSQGVVNINLTYDNKKNYCKALGLPPDSYFYWTENNIIQAKDQNTSTIFFWNNYSNYNNSGYPTDIVSIYYSSHNDTITNRLTYQCQ